MFPASLLQMLHCECGLRRECCTIQKGGERVACMGNAHTETARDWMLTQSMSLALVHSLTFSKKTAPLYSFYSLSKARRMKQQRQGAKLPVLNDPTLTQEPACSLLPQRSVPPVFFTHGNHSPLLQCAALYSWVIGVESYHQQLCICVCITEAMPTQTDCFHWKPFLIRSLSSIRRPPPFLFSCSSSPSHLGERNY